MSDPMAMDADATEAAARAMAESVSRAEAAVARLSARSFDAAHGGREYGARAATVDARLRDLASGLDSWNRETRAAADAVAGAVGATRATDASGASGVAAAGAGR
ncbi:hypothetical protein [Rhodococcoides corynebacterioides]|uniref:Excreted virulence factor EspC (Type VII ESX diderm) n=1 Tax=Rhodococcoides corynebacterioides TaxID=53972 RepID=A0ABS7P017_9NOCA|nr:hypothetical protein [Rhodococcus corynebacterioides]MBY6365727.1 hypothetical protein [Rhodococcus corynebacterioides]MBY6406458.1 hypothetical protein [Rhodococcus corynebacterioides]